LFNVSVPSWKSLRGRTGVRVVHRVSPGAVTLAAGVAEKWMRELIRIALRLRGDNSTRKVNKSEIS